MAVSKTVLDNRIPVGAGQYAPLGTLGPDWLLCDGTDYFTADYPLLSSRLGSLHNLGGEPVGKFRVPNATDRVLVGLDNYGTAMGAANRNTRASANTVGGKGGASSVALTFQNFPHHVHATNESSHGHTITTSAHGHGGHGHARAGTGTHYRKQPSSTPDHRLIGDLDDGAANDGWLSYADSFSSAQYPAVVSSANYAISAAGVGSPPAHENRQPYATLFLHVKAR